MILATALLIFGLTAGIWIGRAYALRSILQDCDDLAKATDKVFKQSHENSEIKREFEKKMYQYGIRFNADEMVIVRGSVAHLAQLESSGSE